MAESVPGDRGTAGLALARRIDAACDRFEAEWHDGRTPRIEELLHEWEGEQCASVFRQMLAVELHFRHQRLEHPTVEDYSRRFPELVAEIQAVFDEFESLGRADTEGPPAAHATRQPVHARCPHCQASVEVCDDRPSTELVCPGCGSRFSIAGDAVLAHRTRGGTLRRRQCVGRFELVEHIASGAFGSVWKACDTQLQRDVALKMPRRGDLSPQEADRFLREARSAAHLRHPNIVSVHEVGQEEDLVFIVTDFVAGVSLREFLTARKLGQRDAALLCAKIADALDYAHRAGVVHRDLKPNNVLLDSANEPYLIDFGLAKRTSLDSSETREGDVFGTPAYMSPEQANGQGFAGDQRMDIYSLGVILYELITGELPFRGDVRMMLRQVIEDAPPSPRRLNHKVLPDLETLCLRCLEENPQHRFETAGELAEELRRVVRGEPIETRPVGVFGRAWRWYCRKPEAPIVAAGGFLVFCATILILWAICGISILVAGRYPAASTDRAIRDIAACLLLLYSPMFWLGIRILNGKRSALWASCAIAVTGLTVSLAGLSGLAFVEGVYGDWKTRMPLFCLLAVVSGIGLLVNIAALVAHLRNPWPESAIGHLDSTRISSPASSRPSSAIEATADGPSSPGQCPAGGPPPPPVSS